MCSLACLCQVVRIKGEGMPKHGTPSEFGDLTILFTVDFPKDVRQRALPFRLTLIPSTRVPSAGTARARSGAREDTASVYRRGHACHVSWRDQLRSGWEMGRGGGIPSA